MMFHVEHSPPEARSTRLDQPRAAPPRQCESDVQKRWCCSRHFTCKSDFCQVFFAGMQQIFLNYASLRQCKSDVQKRPKPGADYTRKEQACQVFFAGLRKIIPDYASLATGTIIWYNLRKPRRGAANLRKF